MFLARTSAGYGRSALAAIVKVRRMRPQAARALSDEARVATLAAILDPASRWPLASRCAPSRHRRPLLAAFLDALGLPHEDGILKDEADGAPPPSVEAVHPRRLAREIPLSRGRDLSQHPLASDPSAGLPRARVNAEPFVSQHSPPRRGSLGWGRDQSLSEDGSARDSSARASSSRKGRRSQ